MFYNYRKISRTVRFKRKISSLLLPPKKTWLLDVRTKSISVRAYNRGLKPATMLEKLQFSLIARQRLFNLLAIFILLAPILFSLYHPTPGYTVPASIVPDGDVTNGWTTNGSTYGTSDSSCSGGTVCDFVDETTPDTSNGVQTGTDGSGGEVQEFDMETIPFVSSASNITVHVEARSSTNANGGTLDNIDIDLRISGTLQGSTTRTPAFNSYGDHTSTYSGTWNQSDIDSLRVHVTRTREGGGQPASQDDNIQMASVYVVVEYTPSITFEQSSYRWFNNADGAGEFGTGGIISGVAATTTAEEVAVDSEHIYIAGGDSSFDGRIEKRDKSTGQLCSGSGVCDGTAFGTAGIVTYAAGEVNTIAVDDNYIYAAGGDGSDFYVLKYDKDDGTLCDGSGGVCGGTTFGTSGVVTGTSASKEAFTLAVDTNYIYVAGRSDGTDWHTEKYEIGSGAICNGSGGVCGGTTFGTSGAITGVSATATAWSIAVDANYLYVTGEGSGDFRVEKYEKDDGDLCDDVGVCGGTVFGTLGVVSGTSASNISRALAVDSNYIYVTGRNDSLDWHTEKYEIGSGALCNGSGGVCGGTTFGASGVATSASDSTDAQSIAVDSDYIYLVGTSGGNFRIEKREITDGEICDGLSGRCSDDEFGASGFINESNSSGNPYHLAVDSSHMYVVGDDDSTNWYTQKRDLRFGNLADGGNARPGSTLAASDTAATPPDDGEFRLRMAMHVAGGTLTAGQYDYKLQFAVQQTGSCDTDMGTTDESYNDVQVNSGDIRFHNNPGYNDGASIADDSNDPVHNTGTPDTNINQTYAESNDFTTTSNVTGGQDALWDFSLRNYTAPAGATYCFRMIQSGGTQLNTYSEVPELDIPSSGAVEQSAYRWFENNDGLTQFGTSGVVDSTTGATSNAIANDVALDDNFIYTAGHASSGNSDWRVEKRYRSDGSLVSGFGSSGVVTSAAESTTAYGIAIDEDYMYVVGSDSSADWRIEKRYLSDGALVQDFGTSGVIIGDTENSIAYDVAVDSNFLYVVGINATVSAANHRIEKRSLHDGSLDLDFGGGDGIIIGGSSSNTLFGIDIDANYMYIVGDSDPDLSDDYDWRIEKRQLSDGAVCDGTVGVCGGVAFDTDGIILHPAGSHVSSHAYDVKVDNSHLYIIGSEDTADWRIEKRAIGSGALDSGFGSGGSITSAGGSLARSISIDDDYMYVTGTSPTVARVEKYELSDGDICDGTTLCDGVEFGSGGVVTGASGSDNFLGIGLMDSSLYLVGENDSSDWRIEKRDADDGGADSGSIIPGDALADQDASAVAPLVGTPFRLRMALHASGVYIPSGTEYKLQYAQKIGTCNSASTLANYGDVANISGGFPVPASISVGAPTSSFFNSTVQNHGVTLPATVESGDLLLALFTNDGDATVTVTTSGWTEVATANNPSNVRSSVWAKIADGTEGSTANFQTSVGAEASALVYRVLSSDWYGNIAQGIDTASTTSGTINSPNPPSLNPSQWALEEALWIAYVGGSSYDGVVSYPANYSSGTHRDTGGDTASSSASSAHRVYSTESADPGNFTMNNTAPSASFTIAVRPAVYDGPTAVADPSLGVTGGGAGSSWADPENIYSSDALRASASLSTSGTTQYLEATDFGFSIPSGSTIHGISVVVEKRRANSLGVITINDNAARIIKGGIVGSTDRSNSTTISTSDSTYHYGGRLDLWGETWSASDINASDFGFAISGKITGTGSADYQINHIQVTIYYSPSSESVEFKYHDNTNLTDGDSIFLNPTDPSHSGHRFLTHNYEESNNFSPSSDNPVHRDSIWDFSLVATSIASSQTPYCFRAVESDGTALSTYTHYPEITMPPTVDLLMRGGGFFYDGVEQPKLL